MKLSARVIICLLAMAMTGLLLCGCGETTTTASTQSTSVTTAEAGAGATATTSSAVEVKIGAIGPFTGQLSKIGLDSVNAMQMAVDEFNDRQDGIRVSIALGDDVADPAKSVVVAEKFVADGQVVGVIGPMLTAASLAVLPVLEKASLAMITQAATGDELSQGGYATFHRVCPANSAQGAVIAGVIAEDVGAKSVFMIDDKSVYGQGLAEEVERTLTEQYKITDIQRAQISEADKDFSAIITKARASGPDVFVAAIPSPAQFAAIAKQIRADGYEVQLVGFDGVKDKTEFIDNAGGATEGTYFASLGPILDTSTDPKAQEFVKKYAAKGWELSLFSGQSYEAACVFLDAIERDFAANGQVTREGVLEALSATKYTGVLGIPIEFQDNGELVVSGVFVGQVKDGRFVQIRAAE